MESVTYLLRVRGVAMWSVEGVWQIENITYSLGQEEVTWSA